MRRCSCSGRRRKLRRRCPEDTSGKQTLYPSGVYISRKLLDRESGSEAAVAVAVCVALTVTQSEGGAVAGRTSSFVHFGGTIYVPCTL